MDCKILTKIKTGTFPTVSITKAMRYVCVCVECNEDLNPVSSEALM